MQALLVFHLNGCGHCREVTGPDSQCGPLADLLPVYEIEASHPLAQEMGISGFPTIVYVNKALAFTREGPRDTLALRKWVLDKMDQTLQLVEARAQARRNSSVQ